MFVFVYFEDIEKGKRTSPENSDWLKNIFTSSEIFTVPPM